MSIFMRSTMDIYLVYFIKLVRKLEMISVHIFLLIWDWDLGPESRWRYLLSRFVSVTVRSRYVFQSGRLRLYVFQSGRLRLYVFQSLVCKWKKCVFEFRCCHQYRPFFELALRERTISTKFYGCHFLKYQSRTFGLRSQFKNLHKSFSKNIFYKVKLHWSINICDDHEYWTDLFDIYRKGLRLS